MQILLVDDKPDSRAIGKRVIEEGGYEVSLATGYHDAIEQMKKKKFDLVLLDYYLGDESEYDGFDIADWIHANKRGTPVAMQTDRHMIELKEKFQELKQSGAILGAICKPGYYGVDSTLAEISNIFSSITQQGEPLVSTKASKKREIPTAIFTR